MLDEDFQAFDNKLEAYFVVMMFFRDENNSKNLLKNIE